MAPQDAVAWSAVLVRPDGYIAWSADGSDIGSSRLRAQLTRWFGPSLDS